MFGTTGKAFDSRLLNEKKEIKNDMVVMGAHGHGAIADAVMGSVSRRVIRRCSKPVLLMRLPKSE
jgi:nucleotide-binding universal stress UspA family protein